MQKELQRTACDYTACDHPNHLGAQLLQNVHMVLHEQYRHPTLANVIDCADDLLRHNRVNAGQGFIE
ncbi:MAG: hypothetical protein ACYDC5_00680 [Candidatus Dormibacteria bacterium]